MENAKPKSGGSGMLWVLILIIVLVLGGVAYFGYKIIFPAEDSVTSDEDDDTATEDGDDATGEDVDEEEDTDAIGDSEDEDAEDETCVQNPPPSGWIELANTYAGYTAYRPGWYYRLFDSGAMLGMGPSPIPTESEYAGDLVIRKHSGTQTAVEAEFTDRLEAGYTETTVTAGCREWKIFEGTEPANEISDAKSAKFAITTDDGVVYSVQTSMAPAGYASVEAKLDIEIDIMVFD